MRWFWYVAIALFVWFVIRRPIEAAYVKRATGLKAARDAATQNRYTTYNTSIYTEPIWQPFLEFLKVGAYVGPSKGNQTVEVVDYSVQG